jgi:hypothetical protein
MNLKCMVLGLLVVLAGCSKKAESTVTVGNQIEVSKLFSIDGCTIYRFGDGGRHHYFSNCTGQASSIQSNGKSTYTESIPTSRY